MSYETPEHHQPEAVAPDGVPLRVVRVGDGGPVTVFAGGVGGTIPETRVLGSGVEGTRAFFDFRGHGGSGAPANDDWSYPAIAGDLRAVADATGATFAVGMSMGAAALAALLAETPDRFERNVFYLLASLDRPRGPVTFPADRVANIVPDGALGLARALATTAPVPSRDVLAAVRVPCLVVGQEGDPTHPAQVSRDLAAALPDARLHVFGSPGGLVAHRAAVRALLTEFLAR